MKRIIWTIYRKRPYDKDGEYFIILGSGPKDGYREMNNFSTEAEAEDFIEKLKTKEQQDYLKNKEMAKGFRPLMSRQARR